MAGAANIDFVDTYSAAYRREVFLANGGFDTIFPTASVEDQELSFRLAEKGYRLVFVPAARVYHRHNPTLRAYVRRKFYIGYWKALLAAWHPARMVRDSHTPQTLKVQMALAAAALGGAALGLAARPVAPKVSRTALAVAAAAAVGFQITSLLPGQGLAPRLACCLPQPGCCGCALPRWAWGLRRGWCASRPVVSAVRR